MALTVLCLVAAPLVTDIQPSSLEPPSAIGEVTVAYPAAAPPHAEPIVVRVKLLVDEQGIAKNVELLTHSLPIFDDAVVNAARQFRFKPALLGGQPVAVEITFSHTFLPPPMPTSPPTVSLPCVLTGRLIEMGTKAPVSAATIVAQVGSETYTALADARGRFSLPLPAGEARIAVHASGYKPFLQAERLAQQQQLAVTYYIERERYDPYEIIIYGERRREELSRMTLRGAEVSRVPGTFGDPYRVVQSLPGVASIFSLAPFPIVRGASPSSTGFLLDGTRVPLLFHLMAGPSVVHPEFIDQLEFYPGGAPVLYGGYTGGIVDGLTRRARPDERLIDVDLNLTQVGGLVRRPVDALDSTVTVAGRYGYPGFLISLANDRIWLSYWDYQLRLDHGAGRNGWTVFAFGAQDTLTDKRDPEDSLDLGFHRLDLRWYRGRGSLDATYRLVAGYDRMLGQGSDLSAVIAEPSLSWRWHHSPSLDVVGGVEGSLHDASQGDLATAEGNDNDFGQFTAALDRQYTASAFMEMLWRPTRRWLIRPGARGDVYYDDVTAQPAVDPRLQLRYRLATRRLVGLSESEDASGVWLKGGVGVYHQPPRFIVQLPGLGTLPLEYGLSRSIQSSIGVEVPLDARIMIDVQTYYMHMDPAIFDLSVNDEPGKEEDTDENEFDRLAKPQLGRAYGVEFMLRRELRERGPYGWLAYTLSRSERKRDGAWVPYDFDRSHLVSLVAGLALKRHWDVSTRLQFQSGRPETTQAGYNTGRQDGYVRVDLRVDKRAVWEGWLLDFYVDITNVALLPEQIQEHDEPIRYILPTVGLRGRF